MAGKGLCRTQKLAGDPGAGGGERNSSLLIQGGPWGDSVQAGLGQFRVCAEVR